MSLNMESQRIMDDHYHDDDASNSNSCSSSSSINGGEGGEMETCSSTSPLQDMSSLLLQLPLKRGLSKHYNGKSQSFTSLSNVESLEDLAKQENPFKKKLKTCKSYGGKHASSSSTKKSSNKRSHLSSHFSGRRNSSFLENNINNYYSNNNNRPPIPPPHRSTSFIYQD